MGDDRRERERAPQELRVGPRHRRRQLRGRQGRGLRPPRAERCREDNHDRDPRRVLATRPWHRRRSRSRSRGPEQTTLAPHANWHRAPRAGGRAVFHRTPGAREECGVLSLTAAGRRGDSARRALPEKRRQGADPFGWATAPAGRGSGDHREPGAAVLRRTDDRS